MRHSKPRSLVAVLLGLSLIGASCMKTEPGTNSSSGSENLTESALEGSETIDVSDTSEQQTTDESTKDVSEGNEVETTDLKGHYRLKIFSDKEYQIFDTFGGSGGWWAQDVGGWTGPGDDSGEAARERIAKLLYDPVEGIGLTSYRYNLGAGSAEGVELGITDPWRRAMDLESAPGVYDWSRDEEAIWMMKEAVRLGADEVVVFANSAPERFKANGKAYDNDDNGGNLPEENYSGFANYALDVVEHFISEGIPVKYISPINEPNWQWTGGQEGTKLQPKEVTEVYKSFINEIEMRPALANLKLSGPESISINDNARQYINAIMREKEILPYLDHIATHIYSADAAGKQSFGIWFRIAYEDFDLRMSEWTEMVGGRDNSMDSGLVLANTVYEDISLMYVTAWQYWILVSKYDYHDGLIYVDPSTKQLSQTKRLWSLGNYSRYIKRGDIRIAADIETSSKINVVAFKSADEDRLTVVLINNNKESVIANPDLPDWANDSEVRFHITSRQYNLEEVKLDTSEGWHLPPESVVTVVIG